MIFNFIINKYIKLFFSIFSLIISIILFIFYGITKIGCFLIIISLIILLLFFKNEFLIISFINFRKGDINNTKKWLSYIKNPKIQLTKNEQAYFFFLKGLIISTYNIKQAEIYIRTALKIGLKYSYNRAIAKLNLATILASRGEKKEAENILIHVKKLDKSGIMHEQIKFVKERLKKINIGKNAQNPYFKNQRKF